MEASDDSHAGLAGSPARLTQEPEENEEDQVVDEEMKPHWWQRLKSARAVAIAVSVVLAASAAVTATIMVSSSRSKRSQRRSQESRRQQQARRQLEKGSGESSDGEVVHIPLKEVVRFKERQWFIEELENSRQGDANAMLRLSKMYLHGQGCEPNIIMAQEWLRKARYLGIAATLDELWAGDPEELQRRLQAARAAAAASNAGSGEAGSSGRARLVP